MQKENSTQGNTERMQEVKNLERQKKGSNYQISVSNSSSFHLNGKKLIVTIQLVMKWQYSSDLSGSYSLQIIT